MRRLTSWLSLLVLAFVVACDEPMDPAVPNRDEQLHAAIDELNRQLRAVYAEGQRVQLAFLTPNETGPQQLTAWVIK